MARAIGAVLGARYSAILNPRAWRPSVASCSAGRSRIATSAPFSTSGRTRSRARDRPRRPHRVDHRDAARRRALELREPADLDRRPAARRRPRSVSARSRPRASRRLRHTRVARRRSRASTGSPTACARCSSPTPKAGCSTSSTSSGGAGSCVRMPILEVPGAQGVPGARARDARAAQRLRGAEPVARDQGLRRRRRSLHVPTARPGTCSI